MNTYSRAHFSDATLVLNLNTNVHGEREKTADILADLAEFDERKLYLAAGYPSLHEYCTRELEYSDDSAFKRIRVARAARRFPAIFTAVAEGRLHLSAVVMLAPHLTEKNVDELLSAASRKSKQEIEQLLAERFPSSELIPLMHRIGAARPAPVGVQSHETKLAPGPVGTLCAEPKATPIAPERYALQVTIGKEAHDALQYAQALLGHSIPSGDLAAVLERLIKLGVDQLERSKFAATSQPRRPGPCAGSSPRHVPAEVKRAVWQRDGGQCTFVATSGHRCPARTRLEFDHAEPVACGGEATTENIRLRCRAHNQYSAERAFGADFMRRKREETRAASGRATNVRPEPDPERDVTPWLRQLGYRADQAKWAAELCDRREDLRDASIEDRIRYALYCLAPSCVRRKAG